jgi:hypothetical protein
MPKMFFFHKKKKLTLKMHFYCYNVFNLLLNGYYLTFLIKLMVGQQEIALFRNEIGWIQIESQFIKVK